ADEITAAQSRAGRGLLDWSQTLLAQKSNLSESTVRDFEKGRRTPGANNLSAMRRALYVAGVKFTNGDEPGVQLDPAYRTCLTELETATKAASADFALKLADIAFQKYVDNSRGPAQVGVWTRRGDLAEALQSTPHADTPAG